MRPLVVLLLLLVGATRAHADRRVIGVLDVKVDGVPAEVASQFQTSLEAQLDSKRYWLSGRSKMKERMSASTKWVDGCFVGTCLFDVKTQTGAEIVLIAAISGSGTSYGYVVTLLRTDNGSVVAQQTDRCDVCTLNEVMTNATLATIQLINAVPDTLPEIGGTEERRAAIDLAVAPLHKAAVAMRHAKKVRGIALTVAGLVIAGAGTAIYFALDKPSYALPIAGAGGGLAVGGITILSF